MHNLERKPRAAHHVLSTDWRPLPVDTGPKHSFALGDIHGHLDVMTAALNHIATLPKLAAKTDLVLLGDLVDRGPASMDCVRLGLDGAAARAGVDNHIYLPGNHEMMMLGAITDLKTSQLWLQNGGEELCDELGEVKTPQDLQRRLRAELGDGVDRLLSGPHHHRAGGLLFVHAGLHPDMSIGACLAQPPSGLPYNEHWAWVREPFLEREGPLTYGDDLVVIHGHTPVASDPGSSGFGCHFDGDPASWAVVDPNECDMIETRRRINLDAGCGKESKAVGIAEFCAGRYRLHVVHVN